MLAAALEDRAEDDERLVGRAPAGSSLLNELVAPVLDLLGGDLLGSPRAKRRLDVRVDDGAVVRQRGWLPVALVDAVGDPVLGEHQRRESGPCLLDGAASSIGQDRLKRRCSVLLAQKAWRRWTLLGPGRPETAFKLRTLRVAPLCVPSRASLADPEFDVAGNGGDRRCRYRAHHHANNSVLGGRFFSRVFSPNSSSEPELLDETPANKLVYCPVDQG